MILGLKALIYKLRYNRGKVQYPYHFPIETAKHQMLTNSIPVNNSISVFHNYLANKKFGKKISKLHKFAKLLQSMR